MSGNQLLNASFERLATAPTTGNFEGRMYYNTTDDLIYVYDGSAFVSVGSIVDIQGTANEVEVSIADGVATIGLPGTINADTTGNAATATALETARTISLGGDLSGSASFDGTQNITINATVDSNAAVDSISNSDGNLDISASTGAVTVDLASSITADVTGDVTGNLTGNVTGNVTGDVTGNVTGNVTGDVTGNADTATALETARTISLGGDLSGSASFDGTSNVTINATVEADSVELGTDTTGDYVADVTAGTGISVTGTGEGASVVVTNAGVVNLAGTANEIEVSASTGSVTVGLPDDVIIGNDLTVSNDLTVTGDLTVSGTTTTVNTETINLADNIITLNSNETGTPSQNAGLEVERGTSDNVEFRWNETSDVWEATTDGSTYNTVLLSGDAAASDISDFDEAAQDAVGGMVANTATVDLTYTDGTPELKADVNLQSSNSYLVSASGLAVDISTLEAKLVTDSFTKKASASVGNGANTSFAITHSLGTRDVVVNVYDNSTYDTVETDVVRTDSNTVTVSFATAPASNAYRVVVIG
jgi:trimeric autotransporter adhesin